MGEGPDARSTGAAKSLVARELITLGRGAFVTQATVRPAFLDRGPPMVLSGEDPSPWAGGSLPYTEGPLLFWGQELEKAHETPWLTSCCLGEVVRFPSDFAGP